MMKNDCKGPLTRTMNSLLLLAVTLFTFTACLNNNDGTPIPPAAFVSFYHGAPDAPGLDIQVDNRRITNNSFNFTEYINYNRFFTGNRAFRFSAFNAVNTLLDTTLTFQVDKAYSIFLADEVAALKALVVEDIWTDPTEGNAKFRGVHLSPDTEGIILEITEDETEETLELDFMEASSFESLPQGNYTFTVKNAEGETLVSAQDIEIRSNRIYSLVFRGFQTPPAENSNGLSLQLITNHIIF
ncbi:DUF4397 domain-containing protein [Pararhodonellum marinum]|uniref:DUF4397 domain-containing protein n=1 Tax=Pararhodonellum marinum TaxID=2755358 RepID=UPI00188FC4B3|nr:DUF4397 domain-containing protein [Pararhodonellum marinum]